MDILSRLLDISLPQGKSAFLWGPRKVGKTYWIREHLKEATVIDLLKTEVFAEYVSRPSLLRDRFYDIKQRVVIDEVHFLIENRKISSWRYTMGPLCYSEIKDFDLNIALCTGLLPDHLLSSDPTQELRAYVADYLKEEIAAEAIVQNIPAFSEFLRIAGLMSGALVNDTNVVREAGVSGKIVPCDNDKLTTLFIDFIWSD